jgi:hypothetical protein
MSLPYDYARCANPECPMRRTCQRFTDIPPRYAHTSWQAFDTHGKDRCWAYIPETKEEKHEEQ